MFKKLVHRIQTAGLEFESNYQNKKDIVAFNSTFLWTTVLIFINIFVALLSGLTYVSMVNAAATVVFSLVLWFNALGFFRFNKHLGIVLANLYVYVMSIVGGPELQFQYAYCIILTMIGFVFVRRLYLIIHLPITILFFVATKISYYHIEPLQFVNPAERDYFAFNNGIIFLVLISVSAIVFRNQTNVYLREIEDKKNVIEEKQKEIFDSINYAHRIQSALLANTSMMNDMLKKDNYFILFQPKDIVSGDFYWATSASPKYRIRDEENGFEVNKFDELFYFAICDSTGHGVPGAFMSLLNMGYLNEAVKEKNIYEPNKIFDYVRKRLIESISEEGQKDGFDGIILCINKTTRQISYAAAHNNPVLVSGKDMIHLPSDKMPVGKGERNEPFKLHVMELKKGDTIYLYTDGYADQFGGPKGKKFKYRQLETLLLENSGEELMKQKQVLHSTFEHWRGDLDQVDDVCLVGIKI